MTSVQAGQRWRHNFFDVDRVVLGLNPGIDGEIIVTWYTDCGKDEDGEPYYSRDGFVSGYYAQALSEFEQSPQHLVLTDG